MDKRRSWDALRKGLFKKEYAESAGWLRLRTAVLTAVAVMLVISATMGSAWAFFTTYARARGGVTLHLGHEDHINEEFKGWEKTLDITITADSNPVYLRARAYSDYDVSYSNSQNWTRIGDWMYYKKTLAPGVDKNGKKTDNSLKAAGDELKVKINDVPKSTDPTLKGGETFNVIVVYESMEVQYDSDGNMIAPENANWDMKVDTNRTSTTLGGED